MVAHGCTYSEQSISYCIVGLNAKVKCSSITESSNGTKGTLNSRMLRNMFQGRTQFENMSKAFHSISKRIPFCWRSNTAWVSHPCSRSKTVRTPRTRFRKKTRRASRWGNHCARGCWTSGMKIESCRLINPSFKSQHPLHMWVFQSRVYITSLKSPIAERALKLIITLNSFFV